MVLNRSGWGGTVKPFLLLASAVMPFLFSVVLWLFPTTIAMKVIPPESDVTVQAETPFNFLVVVVLAIGLFIFTRGLLDGFYWITYSHLMSNHLEYDVMQNNRANMMTTAVEFVFGLAMILRAKFIAGFLYRLAK